MAEPLEERHPSLYFPDGDIALSAKTAAGVTQIFRVDRIFLSRHSEVFRDMFAVSSDKSSGAETYDGVPLVVMPREDVAEDVHTLLDVIYNIECALSFLFCHKATHPLASTLHRMLASPLRADIPLATLGLVKIARKYLVKGIETAVVRHIKSEWPSTLDEWDARSLELRKHPATSERSHPEPVSAIKFALAHGLQDTILRPAFYQLSITPIDTQSHDDTSPEHPTLRARWDMFSAEEVLLFMKGRDTMTARTLKSIKYLFRQSSTGYRLCACSEETFALIQWNYFGVKQQQPCVDFLDALRVFREDLKSRPPPKLCSTCVGRIGGEIDALRSRLWDTYLDIFVVPWLDWWRIPHHRMNPDLDG